MNSLPAATKRRPPLFSRGAAGSQYALIVGLIGVVAILVLATTGGNISVLFNGVGSKLCNAGGSGGCATSGGGSSASSPNAPVLPASLSLPVGSALGSGSGLVVATSPLGYTITLTLMSGSLPPGVAQSGNLLTGTPTGTDGGFVTFKADDGHGGVTTGSVNLKVSDPQWSNVVFLAHMDAGDGTTIFTDVRGHGQTQAGTTVISIANSKFGGSCAKFTASSTISNGIRYQGSDLGMGSSDFTIEEWVYVASFPTSWSIYESINDASALNKGLELLIGNVNSNGTGLEYPAPAGTVAVGGTPIVYGGSPGSDVASSSGTAMSSNAWHHVAMVRNGTTLYEFVDGAIVFKATGVTFSSTGNYLMLGSDAYPQDGTIDGYIDEVRVTKGALNSGAARYTAAFTPPTQPFPGQ